MLRFLSAYTKPAFPFIRRGAAPSTPLAALRSLSLENQDTDEWEMEKCLITLHFKKMNWPLKQSQVTNGQQRTHLEFCAHVKMFVTVPHKRTGFEELYLKAVFCSQIFIPAPSLNSLTWRLCRSSLQILKHMLRINMWCVVAQLFQVYFQSFEKHFKYFPVSFVLCHFDSWHHCMKRIYTQNISKTKFRNVHASLKINSKD